MRTLITAAVMMITGLTGCQSLEAMFSPKAETPQIALAPIYQDLMPVVGSYYALGSTTFLPLSPEDYAQVQAQLTPDDSAAITGMSPELAALSSALRQSGASSCTSSSHCAGLKPTYITTSVLSPGDAAYVLVELKTPELTLQRLYERTSLSPLSALSIQATRTPLYDLSLLQERSAQSALSPDALSSAQPQAHAQSQAQAKTQRARSTANNHKASNQPPRTKAPQTKYEAAPKDKTIAILTAPKHKGAASKSTTQKSTAQKSTATAATKAPATTQAAPSQNQSAQAARAPAPQGALTEAMTQRAQALGVPSESERRQLQAQALRRADAAFINLQRMVPQGTVGSAQLQGAMGATLGSVNPQAAQTLNTVQGAVTTAVNSIGQVGANDNKLTTALSAARTLGTSAQRVRGALSEPSGRPQPNSNNAVFASGPFMPEEK